MNNKQTLRVIKAIKRLNPVNLPVVYGLRTLLNFEPEEWPVICRLLIQLCKQKGVLPNPDWTRIPRSPSKFEAVRARLHIDAEQAVRRAEAESLWKDEEEWDQKTELQSAGPPESKKDTVVEELAGWLDKTSKKFGPPKAIKLSNGKRFIIRDGWITLAQFHAMIEKGESGYAYCNMAEGDFLYLREGKPRYEDISGAQPVTGKDIIKIFEDPACTITQEFVDWHINAGVIYASKIWNTPGWAQDGKPSVLEIIRKFEKVTPKTIQAAGEAHIGRLSVLHPRFILWSLLMENAAVLGKLTQEVKNDKKTRLTAAPKDCPTVPSLPDVNFMPHQAYALAVLDKTDAAILDVDTGGGKTLTMLADALNMLAKGKATRPCIVMPNILIPQQKDEIHNWTKGQVNVLVINSETYHKMGGDKETAWAQALEQIKKAPPNTIVLTSYEFLSTEYYELATGEFTASGKPKYVRNFTRPKDMMAAGVDMVSFDEAHRAKNPSTNVHQACKAFSSVPIKRVASGTIISNNPTDLVGTIGLLDPSIFGTYKQFCNRYAAVHDASKVLVWKPNAQKKIRQALLEEAGVSIRSSAWRHMLPKLEQKVHYCDFTTAQQRVYVAVEKAVVKEILADPELAAAWEEFQADPENVGKDFAPSKILIRLSRIYSYINDPTSEKFSKSLAKADMVSPKVGKVDELLGKHFGSDGKGKVIIFCEQKRQARHIMEHSRFKGKMLYYDASVKANITTFQTSPEKTVLVAVMQSLKEGLNLQVASRAILYSMVWNPGDMQQAFARVFRPGQKNRVSVDILLARKTADMAKFARLVTKLHEKRKVDSDYTDTTEFTLFGMNLDNISTFRTEEDMAPYTERFHDMEEQQKEEAKVALKFFGPKMIEKKTTPKAIKGSEKAEMPRIRQSANYDWDPYEDVPHDSEGLADPDDTTDTLDLTIVNYPESFHLWAPAGKTKLKRGKYRFYNADPYWFLECGTKARAKSVLKRLATKLDLWDVTGTTASEGGVGLTEQLKYLGKWRVVAAKKKPKAYVIITLFNGRPGLLCDELDPQAAPILRAAKFQLVRRSLWLDLKKTNKTLVLKILDYIEGSERKPGKYFLQNQAEIQTVLKQVYTLNWEAKRKADVEEEEEVEVDD